MSFAWPVLAVLVALAVAAPAAGAKDRDEIRTAKQHGRAGLDHFRAGRYLEAVDAFRRAHEYVSDPVLVWNMARAYEELGDVRNAIHYFTEYLTEYAEGEGRHEAQERIGRLRPRLPGRIVIDCGGVGGSVKVGTHEEQACGETVPPLPPGRYAVLARAPGRELWRRQIEVQPDVDTVVRVRWLALRPRADDTPDGPEPPWPAIATLGLGAAILVGGLVFYGSSESAATEYDALHERTSVTVAQIEEQADLANRNATIAATLVGAGVLTSVAGGLWWSASSEEAAQSPGR